MDIVIDIGLTLVLLFIIFKSSTRNKIGTEINFSKIYKNSNILLLIFIPCSAILIADTVWELFDNDTIRSGSFLRSLVFSCWFYIPHKFVVTKDGFYNVTPFGGSELLCSLKQFRSISKNEKSHLKIEYLNNKNQTTYTQIKERFTDKDLESLNQLAVSEGANP